MRFPDKGQKIKTGLGDMKLFTNSIKQTVNTIRNAGITAYYDIIDNGENLEINIRVNYSEDAKKKFVGENPNVLALPMTYKRQQFIFV